MDLFVNADPIIEFFKKIEPIVIFFKEIDNSEIVGIVFGTIFFIFLIGYWYYVCFMNGAKSWSEAIIKFHKKIRFPTIGILVKPIFLKVVITIFMLVALSGLYGILLSILHQK